MYLFQDFKARNMSIPMTIFRLFFDRGMSAVFIFRLSNWFYRHHLVPLAILLKQLNILVNHCEIAYQANIGKGFRIYHALGIVISDCTAGENFTVYQNVSIGKNNKKVENRSSSPIIGDNVRFSAGSVIAGPINIGNNVIVGSNTVVLKDVPDNKKVIGAKAQYIN